MIIWKVLKQGDWKNVVFWDVALFRSCVNRRFGGKYRLHLQGRKIYVRWTSVGRWLQTARPSKHLFKSESSNSNIKLTLHNALIRSVMTYACPTWGLEADTYLLKLLRPQKQVSPHHWKFSEMHIGQRFAHGFQPSVCIRLYNKTVRAINRSHKKSSEWTCSRYRTRRRQAYS
jgi:hypothetical protein